MSVQERPGYRIAQHRLRVGDLGRSIRFYSDALGMEAADGVVGASNAASCSLRYPDRDGVAGAHAAGVLGLVEDGGVISVDDGTLERGYWKTGITVADVDAARDALLRLGVAVSEPQQFLDVGYLCHLADPDGYPIELLQHTFAGRTSSVPRLAAKPAFASATIAHVTLRVSDPLASIQFYCDRFGLRLLSRQVIATYGFTLYFLAGTAERAPLPDIDAVGNREWLWQRPYTVLELQHRWGRSGGAVRYATGQHTGFLGMTLARQTGEPGTLAPQTIAARAHESNDPDGYPVRIAR